MKYKVGDKVRIKSLDWYNENKDINGNVHCGDKVFDNYMSVSCGSVVTIGGIYSYNAYDIQEDMRCRAWSDEMIEGLVEEEVGLVDNFSSRWVNEFSLPDGYIFKDENDNVINATKIFLKKKKKEYPKTYEECLKILGFTTLFAPKVDPIFDYDDDIIALQKLKNCRNAYWKVAGEEMGLGKPWEYNCTRKYYTPAIICRDGYIQKVEVIYRNVILAFPTEEMRDAFYESFKELIEVCKELL